VVSPTTYSSPVAPMEGPVVGTGPSLSGRARGNTWGRGRFVVSPPVRGGAGRPMEDTTRLDDPARRVRMTPGRAAVVAALLALAALVGVLG